MPSLADIFRVRDEWVAVCYTPHPPLYTQSSHAPDAVITALESCDEST
jgi:hypothetical protein